MKNKLNEADSKIISFLKSKDLSVCNYTNFLKIVKNSDYTRDHVYNKYRDKTILVFAFFDILYDYIRDTHGLYKGFSNKELESAYKEDDLLKEKVKILFNIIDNTPNIDSVKSPYGDDILMYVVKRPVFSLDILKKLIDRGCDITKKYYRDNTLLQEIVMTEDMSLSAFKYILSLNKIDINNVDIYGNTLLSYITSKELYSDGKKKLYKSSHNLKIIFDILINEPNIDVNAGCPLITSILDRNLHYDKNNYFFKKLIELPNLDVNKKIKVNDRIANRMNLDIDGEVDFSYLLIGKIYNHANDKNFKFLYNWFLKNSKIDVNKKYDLVHPTLLSYFVAVLVAEKYAQVDYRRRYDTTEDDPDFTKSIYYKYFKDFLKHKEPNIQTGDLENFVNHFSFKDYTGLRTEIKASKLTSITSILDSINE